MNIDTHTGNKIIVFACNWGGWSCIDDAIQKRLYYPPSVKLVRVDCLARLHAGLLLKAFELGADGVMLMGCASGECKYDKNDAAVTGQYEKAREILGLLGIPENRLVLSRLSYGDGETFAKQVTELADEIESLALRNGA
jgi:coenzyme F420-reducing hydrogenase delta subunit